MAVTVPLPRAVETVSRSYSFRVQWCSATRECYRCFHRWVEVVPFKSVRKLVAYVTGPACPRCEPECFSDCRVEEPS